MSSADLPRSLRSCASLPLYQLRKLGSKEANSPGVREGRASNPGPTAAEPTWCLLYNLGPFRFPGAATYSIDKRLSSKNHVPNPALGTGALVNPLSQGRMLQGEQRCTAKREGRAGAGAGEACSQRKRRLWGGEGVTEPCVYRKSMRGEGNSKSKGSEVRAKSGWRGGRGNEVGWSGYSGRWAPGMRARRGRWACRVSLASLGKDLGLIVRWSLGKAFLLFFFLSCTEFSGITI